VGEETQGQIGPSLLIPEKSIDLRGYDLDKPTLKKLLKKLEALNREQGENFLNKIPRPKDVAPEKWEADKEDIRNRAFDLTTVIQGREYRRFFAPNVASVFSEATPSYIEGLNTSNRTAFRSALNREPPNRFDLHLDFGRPPLLDARRLVSEPTPNASHINIVGESEGWIAAIENCVLDTISDFRNRRGFLHRGFVYDLGLLLIAVPMFFYLSWRLQAPISRLTDGWPVLLTNALWVYLFFATLFTYRVIFGYAKWAFPIMELTDQKTGARKHRLILGSLLLAVIGEGVSRLLF